MDSLGKTRSGQIEILGEKEQDQGLEQVRRKRNELLKSLMVKKVSLEVVKGKQVNLRRVEVMRKGEKEVNMVRKKDLEGKRVVVFG